MRRTTDDSQAGPGRKPLSVGAWAGILLASGVVLLLILVGLAAAGHQAVKMNAIESNARHRVQHAREIATARGTPLRAAAFATAWANARPDDHLLSPWGPGLTPPGVVLPDLVGTHPDAPTASAAAGAAGLAKDPSRAGCLIYARIRPGSAGPWLAVSEADSGQPVPARDFLVGIYGEDGTPWWNARGE